MDDLGMFKSLRSTLLKRRSTVSLSLLLFVLRWGSNTCTHTMPNVETTMTCIAHSHTVTFGWLQRRLVRYLLWVKQLM